VVQPWQQRRKQAENGGTIPAETAEVVEVKATTVPFRQRAGSRR
jgi:hypothetical protein